MHVPLLEERETGSTRGVQEDVNPVAYLETGVLYCGDNLYRLSMLLPESVNLIYLDPPFFSNRNYEVIWGVEAAVRSLEYRGR
jgi:16S rRNA G966 N2-methylase RsmD